MNAPARIDTLPRFATVEKAIATMKPGEPVYCIFPEKFAAAAKRFLDAFPGDPLYAIKANPAPHVLDQVWAAGIRHFDTASVPEIEIVKTRFPEAHCHFMSPVRQVGAAKKAFEQYGVTDYVIDCDFELDKLLAETKAPKKLRIFVRIATPARRRGAGAVEQVRRAAGRGGAAAEARRRIRGGALHHLPCRFAVPVALLLCPGDRDGAAHGADRRR